MKTNKICVLLLAFQLIAFNVSAKTFNATSENYQSFLPNLLPGDSLILSSGIYSKGLTLKNINGTATKRICIIGSGENATIFEGRVGANTISLIMCSYLTIKNLKIDGLGYEVDAVKAEGTPGNFTHDITLDNLYIVNHGANQQIVGISTKCTCWNWVIRGNTIISAGTGLYLGNSDGTAPFVNGIIEYNMVINTIGYNMEIKHQLDSLRTIPGMVLNGKTIIRYNVFSKASNASTGGNARPNVLVGAFPSVGSGSNDVYEIYGNFFYQNPVEALFQGTGNIALYSNIFVNNNTSEGFRAVYITKHNNFQPRNINIFHNTLWTKNTSGAIRLYSPNTAYTQTCQANAVFSANPITNFADSIDNLTDEYANASKYFNNADENIAFLDVYPKDTKMQLGASDLTKFKTFTDWDKDFNGLHYDDTYRGAYSGNGPNPGWKLNLDKRPELEAPTFISENNDNDGIRIMPNPARDYLVLYNSGQYQNIEIYSILGESLISENYGTTEKTCQKIDIQKLTAGVYYLRCNYKFYCFIKQ